MTRKDYGCLGRALQREMKPASVAMSLFVSMVGSYIGLNMLQSARSSVMEEDDAGYNFYVTSAGLSFGVIGIYAMNIVGIMSVKLEDCHEHEIHEDFELKLTLLAAALALVGGTLGSHLALQSINDVRLGKVTSGNSSSSLKVNDSSTGFSSKLLSNDSKKIQKTRGPYVVSFRGHKYFEIESGLSKTIFMRSAYTFTFTITAVIYLSILAQHGPFSLEFNWFALIFGINFISIVAGFSLAGAIIIATTHRKDKDLDMKLRVMAALWLGSNLELVQNTSLISCEKYIYWAHAHRVFTSRWNTMYMTFDALLVTIASMGFIVFLLMVAQHYSSIQMQKLQKTHDKLTAKLPENVEELLTQAYNDIKPVDDGNVADYIPELGVVDPEHFAIALCDTNGRVFTVGEHANEYFTIQSVSKALLYVIALMDAGRATTDSKIGEEPSGRPFDEIAIDDDNRASNALINTGAIVSASLIKGISADYKYRRFQSLVKKCSHEPAGIQLDRKVYESEMKTNFNNRAILTELIERGIIPEEFEEAIELKQKLAAKNKIAVNEASDGKNDEDGEKLAVPASPTVTMKTPGEVAIDAYTRACSLKLNVLDIAVQAAVFANDGVNPINDSRVLPKKLARHVVTVMMSCGMYNGAGKWIVDVGIPAKSGVSGVLMCVVPGVCGIGIYSPRLDEHGNSARGVLAAEALSNSLDLHVLRKGGGDGAGSSGNMGSLASLDGSSKAIINNKVHPED